ncbi:MAG: hypothetical protein ACLR1D_00370 [Dialister sp.]
MRFINGIKWEVSQKGKNINRKLSPDTGKVSAELTEGASWSKKVRNFPTEQY